MINVLVPMAGSSQFFQESEYPFPKPLIEIGSKTIIERVVQNLKSIGDELQFIFVVNSSDCRKFHLDATLSIITDGKCKVVRLDRDTKGAACSCLMAVSHISKDSPLVVANYDQLFDDPIGKFISNFEKTGADAGVVTFESVHPRWSYVQVDQNGGVTEVAEKRPISRNAVAGLYYFKLGRDFLSAVMKMIYKNASVEDKFYISPVLNELILNDRKVVHTPVETGRYHTFYTPQKIKEFESILLQRKQ